MNIIKLSAIPSTNDYLREMIQEYKVQDFTVVWAEHQTAGKGQMGAKWVVDSSKNLTFSVLLNGDYLKVENVFTINVIVVNVIHMVLTRFSLDGICIKWPNDILSYNKKIAGILIENIIKSDREICAIVGIGINISQEDFSQLPNASSIFKQYGVHIEQERLLKEIVNELQYRLLSLSERKQVEWEYYHSNLFRKNKVSAFQKATGQIVNAMILGVDEQGRLVLLEEDEKERKYNIKEIKLLY